MKKFIFFARVYMCVIFALPGPGWAQNTNPYPNYVVIGAFEHQNNAIYWTDDANKNKFSAKFEMNPNRNLYYVYVITTDDRKFAFAEALKLRTDTKYFDTWVYSGPLGVLGNRELANSGTEAQDLNPETGARIESVQSENSEKQTGQTDLLSNLQGNGQGEQGRIASNDQLSSNGQELTTTNKRGNQSRKKNAKKKNAEAGVADGSGNNNPENISGQTLLKNDATSDKNDLKGSRQSARLGQESLSDSQRSSALQAQVSGSETSTGNLDVNANEERSDQLNPNSNTGTQPDQNLASDLTSQPTKKKRSNRKQKNAETALAIEGNDQGNLSDPLNPSTKGEGQSNPTAGQDQNAVTGLSVDNNAQTNNNNVSDNGRSTNGNSKIPVDNTGTVTDPGIASKTIDPATGKALTSTTGANRNQAGVRGQTTKGQENAVAKNSNTRTATDNAQASKDTGVASKSIDPATGKALTSTTGANQNQAGVKGQTTKGQENAVAKNSNTKTATDNAQASKDKGVASNTIDAATGKEQKSDTTANTGLPREVKHAPAPKRMSTEPLKPEEVVGKNFYFYLFRAETHEGVEGEVDAVDFEKARKMATYPANSPVKILLPAGKTRQISFVCQVFGYRKLQKEYDPNNPSDDLYLDENGNLVVPFELMRLQRGDIAIMYNVFFFKDAAVMRPESRYEVNNLLELLNENPSYKIMIHGHTNGNAAGKIIRMDKPGNFYSLTNTSQGMGSAKKLSEERALVIREYLISSGVNADRMHVKAWGGKKPIHDKHAVRANENVRVEIEILSD